MNDEDFFVYKLSINMLCIIVTILSQTIVCCNMRLMFFGKYKFSDVGNCSVKKKKKKSKDLKIYL